MIILVVKLEITVECTTYICYELNSQQNQLYIKHTQNKYFILLEYILCESLNN